jgi:membrane-associated protein
VPDWLGQLLHPDLAGLSAAGAYTVLFTLVFVESGLLVGFLLPGDTVLFAAGLLSARAGSPLSLPVLAVGAALAAVAGDTVGYWTGRRLGRPWVQKRAGRAAAHLPRAEAFYERWGWGAIVAARFIPWVRTFTPLVAGVARMGYARFATANVVGALLWGSGLTTLGHVAHSVPWVRYVAYAIAGVSVLMSLVGPLVARRRRRASAR